MGLKGFLGFNNRNKTQDALIKALAAKNSEASVRAFVQAAEALRDSQTEYVFPIALKTDLTKYETPSQTPSHINICVEYVPNKKGFDIAYRVMNLNDHEIGTLKEDELVDYIESNGGISIGASMAHGNNILEARLKLIPSMNKPVSEITRMMAMEVQEALVAGVIPENAAIYMSLVDNNGQVKMASSGKYAEGLQVKGDKGGFNANVSSEDNTLVYPLGHTGLNKKGQLYFETIPQKTDTTPTNLERMDKDYLAYGERDLSDYTNAIIAAIKVQKNQRDELDILINEINDNYDAYQALAQDKTIEEKDKLSRLKHMQDLDSALRAKLEEITNRLKGGNYIDFVLQDPFGIVGPKTYILKREADNCTIGADKKILPGHNPMLAVSVNAFNEAVDKIQQRYNEDVYKRNRKQQDSVAQERAMTKRYGLGSTAIANNTSDSYETDLLCLAGERDQRLKELAESPLYASLFTETYTVLDKTSASRELGMPISVFINPYMNIQEQDKAIEAAFSLAQIGERNAKPELVETVKALMRDSMDMENATGSVSVIGMMDVYEILNERLNDTVTIKEQNQQWTFKIVKSRVKNRDFEFLEPGTTQALDLTELFVACHLRPHFTLTTEVAQGQKRATITDKIKGFFKGGIGEAVKNFSKKLLNPEKQAEAMSEITALSPDAMTKLKDANMAVFNAITSIQQAAEAQFEKYKANELAMLAHKLNMSFGQGAQDIANKAMQQGLISGDKKANLVLADSSNQIWNNADDLAFYIAAKSDGVKEAIGAVYQEYQNLAHSLKENVSLSIEVDNGDVAVKKDLIFPKGAINKPILIEYENKDGKMIALPPHNISKEAAMDVIAQVVENQLYSPFQQSTVKMVEQEKMNDITDVLKTAEKNAHHSSHEKDTRTDGTIRS